MNTRVSDVEFVRAWIDSSSAERCAMALGMKPSGAAARAIRLRRAGVNLPKFARPIKVVDVDGLNALISRDDETDMEYSQ